MVSLRIIVAAQSGQWKWPPFLQCRLHLQIIFSKKGEKFVLKTSLWKTNIYWTSSRVNIFPTIKTYVYWQQPSNTGWNMILDMQKHNFKKLHVEAYNLKKTFYQHTVEMHCICLMVQQVPLDDFCAFSHKFGADWTPKHWRGHNNALEYFAFLTYRRVHLEESTYKYTFADR